MDEIERFRVLVMSQLRPLRNVVPQSVQTARSRDFRVQLPDRAGRRIARIGEFFLTVFPALLV